MQGYTHATIGAASAVALAIAASNPSAETFVAAAAVGALGGIAPDVDVKDNKQVTDAGRTRWSVLGLLIIAVITDFIYQKRIMEIVKACDVLILCGILAFTLVLFLCHFTQHRTVSHSLAFWAWTTVAFAYIDENLCVYYSLGCITHFVLDIVNKTGIRLFYPFGKKGFCLKWCRGDRMANKVVYFIGIIAFGLILAYYGYMCREFEKLIMPAVLGIYMLVAMHLVRRKSEREVRHIMHIKGEL